MTQEERSEISGDVDVLEQAAATAVRRPRASCARVGERTRRREKAAASQAVSTATEGGETTPVESAPVSEHVA